MLLGIGIAMTMSPMTSAAMNAVPVQKAGVASGVLSMFRMVGGSLGDRDHRRDLPGRGRHQQLRDRDPAAVRRRPRAGDGGLRRVAFAGAIVGAARDPRQGKAPDLASRRRRPSVNPGGSRVAAVRPRLGRT